LITYVNRAFIDLLMYEVTDLVGKPFTLLSAQPDPAQTPVFFTLPRRYETTLTRQDGTTVNVAITSTPVETSDQRRSQVIIVRDITQEIAAKRQKDYFFARASHDLRSPLANIMTRLYLLGKKPDQLDTHLKILDQVTSHMLALVNDLLEVSRFERGITVLNRRDLVLQSIVEQVVDVQQADAEIKNIELTAHLSDVPLQVYADPVRLNQVITNIVSNAIHYTPEGGQIDIEAGFGERDGEKCALVCVKDTGIGIAPDHLEHIFDPFYRVSSEREGGSGLGLYIVQEIVQLHGGEISVTSEPSKGTTFSLHLHLSGTTETTPSANPSFVNHS
jgi:PAS domain S-box-containing protein